MRTLNLYRNFADIEIFLRGNKINIGLLMQMALVAGMVLLFFGSGFAQWVSDPSVNTKLVADTHNPIDLTAVSDLNGGSFVFWQDNKFGFQSEVYFIHVDNDGKISFRADGKRVSSLNGPEDYPVCATAYRNSAVVVWNDFSFSNNGYLYAQKVLSDGTNAWGEKGLQITNSDDATSEYSVGVDDSGYTFISYIAKESQLNGDYMVEIQKVSSDGKLSFNQEERLVFKSHDRKMMTSIIPDDSGGAFIFWIEMQNGRSMIFGQHVNQSGKKIWRSESIAFRGRPLDISSAAHNVISYVVRKAFKNLIYAAWQTQTRSKDIYHQLISYSGRMLWERGGKLATPLRGNQLDPRTVCTDSSIILTWTNEYKNNKDIYAQRYDEKGRPQWNRVGKPVIKIHGDQFGQRMIDDGKGGAIVAWIDRRIDTLLADIYTQRINSEGKELWNPLGLIAASGRNTLKSYLSVVPDGNDGVIIIFKNSIKAASEICGQKIFSSGTYSSQIVSFNTALTGDSIKISWIAANEIGSTDYSVERAVEGDKQDISWKDVGSVQSQGKGTEVHYDFYDTPDTSGTLYYRVVQTDAAGDIQSSDVSSINYYGAASGVVLAQNFPNPFSDSTTISFYLPDPADVTVEFFDEHVVKISEIDKSFPAGENKITFYAKGLKPGVYFFRLKAGDFVGVKKMIITN